MAFRRCQTNERPNSFSKRSKSASTAGRSGGFFEKGRDFFSDVFHRQAMAVIGIENEAEGFLGSLEGIAQEVGLFDGNQSIFFAMQDQGRSVPRGDLRQDADELRVRFAAGI